MKTAQEAFDDVVTHLASMTERSVDEEGTCVYRGKNGNRCAIGGIITDEEYKRGIEGSRVSAIAYSLPHFVENYGEHTMMLGMLQRIHDKASNWIDADRKPMKDALVHHASIYNLNTDLLNTIEFVPIVPAFLHVEEDEDNG